MTRTNAAFLIVAVLSGAAAAPAGKPASAPADAAVVFRPRYTPGEKLLLVQETHVQQKLQRGEEPPMKLRLEMRVNASAGKAEGQVGLAGQVSRLVFEGHVPGMGKTSADTDKPETLEQGYGRFLKLLKSVGLSAQLAGGRELRDVVGKGSYFEQMAAAPAPAEQKKQALKMFLGPFRDMLARQWVYLPTRPVGPGETWTVKRSTYAYPLITATRAMPEEVTCRLTEAKKTPAGRVATIAISGTLHAPGGRPGPRTPIQRTGRLRFNLDTGKLVSLRLEARGRLPGMGETTLTRQLTLSPLPKARTRPARAGG